MIGHFTIYLVFVWAIITVVLTIRMFIAPQNKYLTGKYSRYKIYYSSFPFCKCLEKGVKNDDIAVLRSYQRKVKMWLISLFTPCFYFLLLYLTTLGQPDVASGDVYITAKKIILLEKKIVNFKEDFKRYPSSNEGLISLIFNPDNINDWNGPYIKYPTTLEDYWENKFKYIYPPKYGTKEFDIYSFGFNGIDDYGLKDDITNWSEVNKKYYKNSNLKLGNMS